MAMTADLMILIALSDKERYRTLVSSVPDDLLSPDLSWLLKWFKPYWKVYPNHNNINPEDLLAMIKMRGRVSEEKLVIVEHIINQLKVDVTEDMVNGVVQQLTDRNLAGQASKLILDYQSGAEIDLAYELQQISTKAFETSVSRSGDKFITGIDLNNVMDELSDDGGLRLTFLRGFDSFMRPMLPGDTVLVAAAPGAGKTSLVANIVTSLTPQINDLYHDRPVLWLNNEGSGNRILSRVVSSALNATYDEVMQFKRAGTLEDQYSKAMCGSKRLLIKDAHGYSMANVERLVQTVRPCIVIFDMMAHFSLGIGKVETYEKVERLWQVARELAVKYSFVAIGTSQFSVEGIRSTYPTMENLKDSKVGVQGAIETMLFMGKSPEESMDKIRYFSCPKVKRVRTGVREMRFEAFFDTDRCRFSDHNQES